MIKIIDRLKTESKIFIIKEDETKQAIIYKDGRVILTLRYISPLGRNSVSSEKKFETLEEGLNYAQEWLLC